MKKYTAKPLEDHLQDLNGDPCRKVQKLVSITYIYNSPSTPLNVKKYLRTEGEPTFEVLQEKDENGKTVPNGTRFSWETPIVANTKTIGQFVSVATALGIPLYWEEETYLKYIHLNNSH